ncbi:MAG: hypothetical protein JSR61_08380 [Proteobacteria bacterium]|nr:hypothetical protein [Pseudomonadota bacterium]
MADRSKLKAEAGACLGQSKPAGELVDCVSAHFPDVEVFRENDDLIIKGGHRFLIVRRAGPDAFRVSENVSVPSTNLVDSGGGMPRTLDQLIDEIATLAE